MQSTYFLNLKESILASLNVNPACSQVDRALERLKGELTSGSGSSEWKSLIFVTLNLKDQKHTEY